MERKTIRPEKNEVENVCFAKLFISTNQFFAFAPSLSVTHLTHRLASSRTQHVSQFTQQYLFCQTAQYGSFRKRLLDIYNPYYCPFRKLVNAIQMMHIKRTILRELVPPYQFFVASESTQTGILRTRIWAAGSPYPPRRNSLASFAILIICFSLCALQ